MTTTSCRSEIEIAATRIPYKSCGKSIVFTTGFFHRQQETPTPEKDKSDEKIKDVVNVLIQDAQGVSMFGDLVLEKEMIYEIN